MFQPSSLPAFLTKALMQLNSLDPKVICLSAIEAIREHATNCAVTGLVPGDDARYFRRHHCGRRGLPGFHPPIPLAM
jgi:hypothetical protein